MTLDEIRNIALSLPFSTEGFPFNQTTLVFKVGGKMFLLIDVESPDCITLKVNPEDREQLIESHDWIAPGFHMNKNHWITVSIDTMHTNAQLVSQFIKDSHALVYGGLTKKVRDGLENR